MAIDPQITGFNADAVRKGLHLAMAVGLPTNKSDQPTFFMPRTETASSDIDAEGVPFDPSYIPTYSAPVKIQVPCGIEYIDGEGKLSGLGITMPTKVILTLLDVDYTQVQGFEYVVIAANRYFYRRTETPKGLVSVGLYKVHCAAEDEG